VFLSLCYVVVRWLTTTTGDRTAASVQAFPTNRPRGFRVQVGITLLPATASPLRRSFRDCTTSIAWSHWRLDRRGRCRPGRIIAEHRRLQISKSRFQRESDI
jgi:hypothetical protein